MIIEKQIVTESGVTFNRVTHSEDIWFCVYNESTNQIMTLSLDSDPMLANTVTDTKLEVFGATSHEELMAEIENRSLILPEVEE